MVSDPRQVREAIRATEIYLQGLIEPTNQQMHEAERTIHEMNEHLVGVSAALHNALDEAEEDLNRCEAYRDEDGGRLDCRPLARKVDKFKQATITVAKMQEQFNQTVGHYKTAAAGAQAAIANDIPAACHWLRARESALAKFDDAGSIGVSMGAAASGQRSSGSGNNRADHLTQFGVVAMTTGNAAMLSVFNSYFDGMGKHGSKHRRESQAFLRSLADDPNQPRHVRGWIQQEIGRIERTKKALAEGRPRPGGGTLNTWQNIRAVPGYDVGHRFPGLDMRENYRLENRSMNRSRYHIAKKLGLQDKFR